MLEYQSNSKHFAKSGQLIEARVLVFIFGRFLFFQAPASYHLRLLSWMMNSFWEKSGQPLMRDLFFIFRAPLFALLLLYFLLRPLRHCYYTFVEEARQKEYLWKGGWSAEEEFFCSAKSCFCLSFWVFVGEKDPEERSCLESFQETLPLFLLLLNTLCNLAVWIKWNKILKLCKIAHLMNFFAGLVLYIQPVPHDNFEICRNSCYLIQR